MIRGYCVADLLSTAISKRPVSCAAYNVFWIPRSASPECGIYDFLAGAAAVTL
jgi:hypothetical protein